MATPTPNPSDSSNANLIAQVQGSNGALTSAPTLPVNDISQLSGSESMYLSGGTNSSSPGYVPGRSNPSTGDSTQAQTTTVADWMNKFYTQIAASPSALQQFSTEAQLAGLVGANANIAQLYSAWQKLIVQAYNYDINKQQMTPWDVLANSIPGVAAGTYKDNSGYTYVTGMTAQQAADIATKAADTSKQNTTSELDINYTDPDTARYVLNQASQQLLGRQATNDEIASFTKNLNSNEANFPKMTQDTKSTEGTSVTTPGGTSGTSTLGAQGQTVVGYDAAGNPIYGPTGGASGTATTGNTTDTVVSLGEQDYTRYGREQMAEDAAKAAPDYGAYQAAGPLFQAFLGALKGAVQGVGSNA